MPGGGSYLQGSLPLTQGDWANILAQQQPPSGSAVPMPPTRPYDIGAVNSSTVPAASYAAQPPVPMPPVRPADLAGNAYSANYGVLPAPETFNNLRANAPSGADAESLIRSRMPSRDAKALARALIGTIAPGSGMLAAGPQISPYGGAGGPR